MSMYASWGVETGASLLGTSAKYRTLDQILFCNFLGWITILIMSIPLYFASMEVHLNKSNKQEEPPTTSLISYYLAKT